MSKEVYVPPQVIALKILGLCIATLKKALETHEDKGNLISPEQVRWRLPKGDGWVDFLPSGGIRITHAGSPNLCYGGADAPAPIRDLILEARSLLQEWQYVRAAVSISKLF